MGFRLETAAGTSVAIRVREKGGAATAVDLEAVCLLRPRRTASEWVLTGPAARSPTKVAWA